MTSPGLDVPTKLSRVPKIIIRKSIGKGYNSTRNLAKYISSRTVSISKDTIHRYLRDTIGAKAYKRPSYPKLTEKQKLKRLEFCQVCKTWTGRDWERVLFSDESPFELFHPTNKQNDRFWDINPRNIPPVESVKNPPENDGLGNDEPVRAIRTTLHPPKTLSEC